ncbi:MAG: NAD(P)H-hydrate dehydratase [Lachnospiraceae bacterium]|nr:NAD(P)H-hydrate dehydratase [Lachnospiraceae bacterium]
MRELLKAAQMRACDEYTSDYFGIDSAVLMERAALATFISICNCGKMYEDTKTLVVCGTGNNGADGLALTRILYESGYACDYCIPFKEGKKSELFKRQLSTLLKYEINETDINDISGKYDIIVDAVFGIGLSRNLSKETADFIEKLNCEDAFRVSMDIPSGINADSGTLMGNAFKADLTVTFAFAKPGLLLYPGKKYAGKLLIANIGITGDSLKCLKGSPVAKIMEREDLIKNLPKRNRDGNKGTFGKVLIYAGSEQISGACVLSCLGALKSGAGMVKAITNPANADIIKKTVPEAMVTTINPDSDKETADKIKEDISWCDVIVAGPGIGTDDTSEKLLYSLLETACNKPVVIDADGLNTISRSARLQETIKNREGFTVFTPHMGELSRLTKISVDELKADIIKKAGEYAGKMGICLVAKDAVSTVCYNGESVLIDAGNDGMATAGSGDVLSGIMGAMMANKSAEKTDCFAAVLNAVYLHGMAGNACLSDMASDSITAGDIFLALPKVIKDIRDEQNELEENI